jgi:hypothetical protein
MDFSRAQAARAAKTASGSTVTDFDFETVCSGHVVV